MNRLNTCGKHLQVILTGENLLRTYYIQLLGYGKLYRDRNPSMIPQDYVHLRPLRLFSLSSTSQWLYNRPLWREQPSDCHQELNGRTHPQRT